MKEKAQGRRAGRKSGAFAFMDDRPSDIVVIVRHRSEDCRALKQIQMFYSQGSRLSSYVFDDQDPVYSLAQDTFTDGAAKVLLVEIKSRVRAKEEFTVWYYSTEDKDLIETIVGEYQSKNPQYVRYVDELARRSRIIDQDYG